MHPISKQIPKKSVTPIHKGGDALDLNNYRPISIISSIAKVFEKRMFKQLFKYISDFSIPVTKSIWVQTKMFYNYCSSKMYQ